MSISSLPVQLPAPLRRLAPILLLGSLCACGGDAENPIQLSFATLPPPPPSLSAPAPLMLVAERAANPTVLDNKGGEPDSDGCQVEPELPQGLWLGVSEDASTCAIMGAATQETERSDYVVTATNEGGMSTVTLSLTVGPTQMAGISSLSSGQAHSCAVNTAGQLLCWGLGAGGRLGTGGTDNLAGPTQTGDPNSNWRSVSAGSEHTCAIGTDNFLYCWGSGRSGRLGLGFDNQQMQTEPMRVSGTSRWSQVNSGGAHTCAIDQDGGLWCWGGDLSGQLGTDYPNPPRPADQGGRVAALYVPTQTGTATDWTQVDAGIAHTCAVNQGGELWCWGEGDNGRLGIADQTGADHTVPIRVGTAADWMHISAGNVHTCAINRGGELWCWGNGDDGRLGNGDTNTQNAPARVGTANNWTAVSAGQNHTCAINQDEELYCWGANTSGQVGNNSSTSQTTPVQVGADLNWTRVSAGDQHTCAADTTGLLYCWGLGENNRLGNGDITQRSLPTRARAAFTWTSYDAGLAHTCAVRQNGELYCWGENGDGQLGLGNVQDRPNPTRVGTRTNWTAVSTGHAHTCALSGGAPWCWGKNDKGQLGNGTNRNRSVPVRAVSAGEEEWNEVIAGAEHTCGIRNGEDLYCWGYGANGRLGNGSESNLNQPTLVTSTMTKWVSTDAGTTASCGVNDRAELWCWGLLDAEATANTVPRRVGMLSLWKQASIGGSHFCATLTNNHLRCAGTGADGQLGNGEFARAADPVEVIHALGGVWDSVSSGRGHTCAVSSRDTLHCWGNGQFGQIGIGSTDNTNRPRTTGSGIAWRSVRAGSEHNCALTNTGQLWCWGRGQSGQLGNGNTDNRNTPVRITLP